MMAYTGTTNYGFQKPAKENAFTVDDLNNALDKIDETIKDLSDNASSGSSALADRITAVEQKNVSQDNAIAGKVDIAQGAENAGKLLTVGDDGNLTPKDLSISPKWTGNLADYQFEQISFAGEYRQSPFIYDYKYSFSMENPDIICWSISEMQGDDISDDTSFLALDIIECPSLIPGLVIPLIIGYSDSVYYTAMKILSDGISFAGYGHYDDYTIIGGIRSLQSSSSDIGRMRIYGKNQVGNNIRIWFGKRMNS